MMEFPIVFYDIIIKKKKYLAYRLEIIRINSK